MDRKLEEKLVTPQPLGSRSLYYDFFKNFRDYLAEYIRETVTELCISGNTLLLTNHGWEYASEIKKGDRVVTHKGRFKTIRKVFKRKDKVIKLKVANLPVLEITSNHPVLSSIREYNHNHCFSSTIDWGWKKVSELIPTKACRGGSIVASLINREFETEKISRDMAWMYGYYTAEGSYNDHQVRFSMNIKEDKQRKRIMKIIRNIGYKPSFREHRDIEGITGIVCFGSSKWAKFFRNESKIKENKQIPWIIFNSARKQKISFLEGYISGDGYCGENGIVTNSISKKISFGIWQLYKDCGFNARIDCRKNKGGRYDFKHKNGKTYKAKPQWATTLPPNEAKQFLKEAEVYKENVPKKLDYWESFGSQSNRSMQVKKYKRYYAHPVKKIEYGEEKDVYNFEVAEDNSYIADGVVVHNCISELPVNGTVKLFDGLTQGKVVIKNQGRISCYVSTTQGGGFRLDPGEKEEIFVNNQVFVTTVSGVTTIGFIKN